MIWADFIEEFGMVAMAEKGHAAADQGFGQALACRHAQAAVVHEGAAALFGGVKFVPCRVEDHAGDDLPVALQRDRDGEDRDAVQEVGRAVERIDDPAMLGVLAFDLAALLHQEAPVRAGARQFIEDDLLGPPVGIGDEVGRALHRDLEVLHLAEVAGKRATGLGGGLRHHVEQR